MSRKCQSCLQWEQRYQALAERMADALKPLPVAVSVATPNVVKEPSLVQKAIREQSGSDLRLRAYFQKRALDLKAHGKTEAEIVKAITTWSSTEEEPPRVVQQAEG